MCHVIGPGPGAYQLPTLVGYCDHDVRKTRNPSYSFGLKPPIINKTISPGPNYDVAKLTRFGQLGDPKYTMGYKAKTKDRDGPGPAAYFPDKPHAPRRPIWSMADRVGIAPAVRSPGPAAYALQYSPVNPCYTMSKRTGLPMKQQSPGPAQYYPLNCDRGPQYTIRQAMRPLADKSPNPGPAGYYPCINDCLPKYSFGVKHACFETPLILPADGFPCA